MYFYHLHSRGRAEVKLGNVDAYKYIHKFYSLLDHIPNYLIVL
jgi:hypothetical protein